MLNDSYLTYITTFNSIFHLGMSYTILVYIMALMFYAELMLIALVRPKITILLAFLFIVFPMSLLLHNDRQGASTLMFWFTICALILSRFTVGMAKAQLSDFNCDEELPMTLLDKLESVSHSKNVPAKIAFPLVLMNLLPTTISYYVFSAFDVTDPVIADIVLTMSSTAIVINILSIVAMIGFDPLIALVLFAMIANQKQPLNKR